MNTIFLDKEEFYHILEYIEDNPGKSQREISCDLNYSLGKVNFLLKELKKVGLIKLDRFLNSKRKWSYHYIFTPKGVKQKMDIAKKFLKRKEAEYELLRIEIERLKSKIKSK